MFSKVPLSSEIPQFSELSSMIFIDIYYEQRTVLDSSVPQKNPARQRGSVLPTCRCRSHRQRG